MAAVSGCVSVSGRVSVPGDVAFRVVSAEVTGVSAVFSVARAGVAAAAAGRFCFSLAAGS